MSLSVDITKRCDGFTLHAKFEAENTATALLGASGSGKSMTLQCIAGVVQPDDGCIVLDGRTLFDRQRRINLPPQQRRVGLLFQSYALFPHMTLEQNVLCGLHGRPDAKETCAKMLKSLRLDGLAKRLPGQLSGGEQQRGALARILVTQPELLMLDEPFSALDSYLRESVESDVAALLESFGGAALVVTHSRDEAYRLCKNIVVLQGGQVLRSGTTKEVFADPQQVAAARLTGCKNILPCVRLSAHSIRLLGWDAVLAVQAEVGADCGFVGIRAHDLVAGLPRQPNALAVRLSSVSENPFDWNLQFAAPDNTAQLWWKISKTTLGMACPTSPAYLCVPPAAIMPLKGEERP